MSPVVQPKPSRRSRRWAVALSAAGLATAGTLLWGGLAAVDTVQALAADPTSSSPAAAPDAASTAGERPPQQPAHAGSHAAPSSGASVPDGQAAPVVTEPKAPARGMQPAQGKPSVPPAAVAKTEPAAGKPGARLTEQTPAEKRAVPGARKETSLAEAGATAVKGPAGTAPSGAGNGQDRSTGLALRGPIDPSAVTGGDDAALGGCLPEYGADGQCLPVVPPSLADHARQMTDSGLDPRSMPHPWSCDEVRLSFPDGLAVRQPGVDPQSLDTDDDGTACDAGD